MVILSYREISAKKAMSFATTKLKPDKSGCSLKTVVNKKFSVD